MSAKYTRQDYETDKIITDSFGSVGEAIFEAQEDMSFKTAWPMSVEDVGLKLGFSVIQKIIDSAEAVVAYPTAEHLQISFETWKENNKP